MHFFSLQAAHSRGFLGYLNKVKVNVYIMIVAKEALSSWKTDYCFATK